MRRRARMSRNSIAGNLYRRAHDEIPREDSTGDGRREGHRRRDGEAARLRRARRSSSPTSTRRPRRRRRRRSAVTPCVRRDEPGGRRGGGRGRRRAGGSLDIARHVRGDHPRQPALQDDRRRLGRGHRHAPEGHVLRGAAAQKHMVEQRSGKMVLISSTSALGNRGQTNYSAAKAGLQGMTKTLAIELGPFNVNVNCVAPGLHRDGDDAADRGAHGRAVREVHGRRSRSRCRCAASASRRTSPD